MDFSSISSINNYIKTLNMKNMWEKNKANLGKGGLHGGVTQTSGANTTPSGSFGDERLTAIIAKMQSGQELSAADMEYLRDNYPAAYDDAVKLEKEKKGYEKALRRCKTKEDARILQMGKVSEALTALKSGTANSAIVLAKLAKMSAAYIKFTRTSHYAKLAENHAELAKAIEAQKEAVSGKNEGKAPENKDKENKAQTTEDVYESRKHSDSQKEAVEADGKSRPLPPREGEDTNISDRTYDEFDPITADKVTAAEQGARPEYNSSTEPLRNKLNRRA